MKPKSLLLLLLVAALVSCNRDQSPIVTKIKDAGSADPADMSVQALDQWFGQHRELAKEVAHDCQQRQQKPTAESNRTVEEKVCSSAIETAALAPIDVQGSEKRY